MDSDDEMSNLSSQDDGDLDSDDGSLGEGITYYPYAHPVWET